jgi:hypothetical protein
MVDQVGTGVDRQAERYAAHALRTFINYDLTNESMLAALSFDAASSNGQSVNEPSQYDIS